MYKAGFYSFRQGSQADGATIVDAVEKWKTLQGKFREYNTAFETLSRCSISCFVRAQIATGEMQEQFGLLTIRILLPPSSAGLERVFPSLGFVHSDVRNRLGHEKATKLAFVMRALLSKEKQC